MTSNVCQSAGLCNGATGVVVDIVYEVGATAPGLPRFVLVDFGENYRGPSFFPNDPARKGWVPVHPITATWWTHSNSANGYEEHTRTQLPLKPCWAWTIWKAQGQTIRGKVVVNLGSSEKEHGLTYTTFSRVTHFSDIGLRHGICKDRLCVKIRQHKKVAPRLREEARLRRIAVQTQIRMQQLLALN